MPAQGAPFVSRPTYPQPARRGLTTGAADSRFTCIVFDHMGEARHVTQHSEVPEPAVGASTRRLSWRMLGPIVAGLLLVACTTDSEPTPLDPTPAPTAAPATPTEEPSRSEEHTSELQSRGHLVCRLLLE